MGAAAGGAAAGGSIASIGTSFYASILKSQADTFKAQGESNADIYQAERLDQAAQYGDLKATQTTAQMTRNLVTTLGNIDAVRAAAHTDPTSPTGASVRNTVEAAGETQRSIAVGNINAQTAQEKSDAAYYRTSSANALLSGKMASTADLVSGAAGALGSVGKSGDALKTVGGWFGA